jgi:hypothetical protein
LVSDGHLLTATTAGTWPASSMQPTSVPRVGPRSKDGNQLWAETTAALSAELKGSVPPGLVAEIVRAVLDESRQGGQVCAVELTIREARVRLERFIRARTSR